MLEGDTPPSAPPEPPAARGNRQAGKDKEAYRLTPEGKRVVEQKALSGEDDAQAMLYALVDARKR